MSTPSFKMNPNPQVTLMKGTQGGAGEPMTYAQILEKALYAGAVGFEVLSYQTYWTENATGFPIAVELAFQYRGYIGQHYII